VNLFSKRFSLAIQKVCASAICRHDAMSLLSRKRLLTKWHAFNDFCHAKVESAQNPTVSWKSLVGAHGLCQKIMYRLFCNWLPSSVLKKYVCCRCQWTQSESVLKNSIKVLDLKTVSLSCFPRVLLVRRRNYVLTPLENLAVYLKHFAMYVLLRSAFWLAKHYCLSLVTKSVVFRQCHCSIVWKMNVVGYLG